MNTDNAISVFAPGSYRDPRARVFFNRDRVLRAISPDASAAFRQARETGLLDELVSEGKLVPFWDVEPGGAHLPPGLDTVGVLLEHERLPFISYPYEWAFTALKEAALLHLEIQLRALERNLKLIDASAYNIQFQGPWPVFIDHSSFGPYEEDEAWIGHRQFCEQFLNPLVLHARAGVPFNDWFRGSLEGLTTRDLASVLPFSSRLSPVPLIHITLPAFFENKAVRARRASDPVHSSKVRLPRPAFRRMLRSLRKWIGRLKPKETVSVWSGYAEDNIYAVEEAERKSAFVAEFAGKRKPALIVDVGCNTGDYSKVALANGARRSIGLEPDPVALDQAFRRARSENLDFFPLYQNIRNPSPGQGWNGEERSSLRARTSADGVLALAVLHHIVIGCHVPMGQALAWIVGIASDGVIEFVPPSDAMVMRLLSQRGGVAHDYSADHFDATLGNLARVVKSETISASGRRLVWYSHA